MTRLFSTFGDVLGNLLRAAGYQVHKEYYVNDAGRQMQILALSVWLRYLTLNGDDISLPANAYQGSYIIDIAKQLQDKYQQQFLK